MLTAERNRLEHAVGPIRRSLVDHIRWLERRVAAVDRDLEDTIGRSPVWGAMRRLLTASAFRCHVALVRIMALRVP